MQYNPDEPLIYLHIPKCAGLSLDKVFVRWYGKNFYRHYFDEKNNLPPEKHAFSGRICIAGHFNKTRKVGVFDYYPDARQIISFFRDPLEVQISVYFYSRLREKRGINFREGKKVDYKDEFGDINRFLAKANSYVRAHIPWEITEDNYKEILDDRFLFIGVVEYMQDSVNRLARVLGKPEESIPWANRSERFEEIDDKVKQEFKERHRIEYLLYEHVLDRYISDK